MGTMPLPTSSRRNPYGYPAAWLPDGFLRPFGTGCFFIHALLPGASLSQGLVTDAPADVAGLDAYAATSAFFVECRRMNQPVAYLAVNALAYFLHRHVEQPEQGLEFLERAETVILQDGLTTFAIWCFRSPLR